jgi:hypothetical protein
MDTQDEILTAYCGLYCGDCLRYKSKASDLANELSLELEKVKFDKYAKVKSIQIKDFVNYQELISLLDEITRLKCDTPCRSGGDGCYEGKCEFKKCVFSKGYQGCWECDELEQCSKFEYLKPFSGDAPRQNLLKIKDYGLKGWAVNRDKFYRWL